MLLTNNITSFEYKVCWNELTTQPTFDREEPGLDIERIAEQIKNISSKLKEKGFEPDGIEAMPRSLSSKQLSGEKPLFKYTLALTDNYLWGIELGVGYVAGALVSLHGISIYDSLLEWFESQRSILRETEAALPKHSTPIRLSNFLTAMHGFKKTTSGIELRESSFSLPTQNGATIDFNLNITPEIRNYISTPNSFMNEFSFVNKDNGASQIKMGTGKSRGVKGTLMGLTTKHSHVIFMEQEDEIIQTFKGQLGLLHKVGD